MNHRRARHIATLRDTPYRRPDLSEHTSVQLPSPAGTGYGCRVVSPSVVVFVRSVTGLRGRMAVVTLDPADTMRLLSAILWELPAPVT